MYKDKYGNYETSVTINGKRHKFRGKTQAEVKKKIAEFNTDTKQGRCFNIVAEEWYQRCTEELRYHTYATYRSAYRHAVDYFGKRHMGDIKPMDVAKYMNTFEDYAKDSKRKFLSVLKLIFNYAVQIGEIDINPCLSISTPKSGIRKERRSLTDEEIAKINAYHGEYELLLKMLLYTGCRRSELFALTYADIDFQKNTITIDKQLTDEGGHVHATDELKSFNGARTIPLLEPLKEILPRNRIGIIFPNIYGEYMCESSVKVIYKKAMADVGIEGVTMHYFRHTFATMLYEMGIDERVSAKMLGHDVQTMVRTYQHLRDEHYEDVSEKINELIALKSNLKVVR